MPQTRPAPPCPAMAEDTVKRRCAPIYDAIEAKNYKLALKLAKVSRTKYPDAPLINALYAVSLERLGRVDEALQAARQVCKDVGSRPVPTFDDHVVNTLTIVFKAAGKLDELIATLESAAGQRQDSVGAHQSLFNACARSFSYLKMQQVAMKLYKRTQDHTFVFWAVASIYLQALGDGKTTLLQLAETMLKRSVKEKGLGALAEHCGPDAVLLYIEVLYSQGGSKHPEALNLLRSTQGKGTRLLKSQLSMLEVVLCISCKEIDVAADILEKHIQANQEDWHAAKVFMDILMPVGSKAGASPYPSMKKYLKTTMDNVVSINPLDKASHFIEQAGDSVSYTASGVERVKALLDVLEDLAIFLRKVRTVYLMKLDFYRRQLSHADSEGNAKESEEHQRELTKTLFDFWKLSGSNISFSNDILEFLPLLSESSAKVLYDQLCAERSLLTEKLNAALEKENHSYEVKKVYCQALSSLEVEAQLMHRPGKMLVPAMKLLTAGSPLYGDFDERENTIADPLLILCSKLYWSQICSYKSKPQEQLPFLAMMICLLESGISNSPYNSSMLLSLTLLYGYLGASDLSCELFWKLEIKYIQLETIGGHMLLPYLSSTGNEREALKFCDKHVIFQEDHERNAGDTFAMTFKHGTYLESIDFYGFRKRLGTSAVRYSIAVERSILNILQKSTQGLRGVEQVVSNECRELQRFKIQSEDDLLDVSYNQDLSVRPDWAPPLTTASPHGCLDWWDKWDNVGGSCWWQSVNAVNLEEKTSAAYREQFRKSIVHRYMLVQAFGVLISSERSLDQFETFTNEMARTLGVELNKGNDQLRLENVASDSQKLHILTLSVFICSGALMRFTEKPDEANAKDFSDLLNLLQGNIAHVHEVVFSDGSKNLLSQEKIFFGGKAVPFTSTYVREAVSWSALCFQKWQEIVQEMKKKQKKISKSFPDAPPLISQVKRSCVELFEGFKTMSAGLMQKIEAQVLEKNAEDLSTEWVNVVDGDWDQGDRFFREDGQEKVSFPALMQNIAECQLATTKVALDRWKRYLNLIQINK